MSVEQKYLFDVRAIPGDKRHPRYRSQSLPLHHFLCKKDGEWRVIEAEGEVVSVVHCHKCGRVMREVTLIQTDFGLFKTLKG
ncbi:hypothetical protein K1I37_00145 [Alicyclobacillus acidoterrestris]|uniref:Uncharacterized protein n=1 Tax=Alicyclobacillus acidoterrestris (strain ATCC 49025 / DSM 3922 / CIP 106132 / NCIMB 13137 / GD3B) TaxID=1356854 RepID=T0D252_ALIAG|nr:hypothetical protein [Alicyclobacillus acidoterrestris]EPZ43846.1 hypothetical protein N007_12065 [Alicyclobacillus acidoterrestris ATCC 49025]UNO49022.1 hypothetical protein K1I37_00145 [Alicyclobacillus acidoterrestris]